MRSPQTDAPGSTPGSALVVGQLFGQVVDVDCGFDHCLHPLALADGVGVELVRADVLRAAVFVERVADREVTLRDVRVADPTRVGVVCRGLVADRRFGVGELRTTAADGALPGGHTLDVTAGGENGFAATVGLRAPGVTRLS